MGTLPNTEHDTTHRHADVSVTREYLTVPREHYEQLKADAEIGRSLREWEERAQAVEASHAISAAHDWRRIAAAPSNDELQRRRAVIGPNAREIDPPEVVARWVATGSSQPTDKHRDQQRQHHDETEREIGR